MQEQKEKTKKPHKTATSDIAAKINEAENVLIALSKNPTADELAAAIGLSLFLDKAGKHATAIYSGETPNILEFLEPEQRLEANTDSLQDFIIAINKDKADHLRYKVEGDYVRVYITPYKTKISAEDLEFSHGDFNIGLVVALNVPSEESLDAALTNHGRILHDAEIINIAATASGDFGQTQWLDPTFSSVSEMIANLVFNMEAELGNDLDKETATALLTGIFVATDRFSNGRTQPETMNMAAKLMSAGADQQQISAHLLIENDSSVVEPKKTNNSVQSEITENDLIFENDNSENDTKLRLDENMSNDDFDDNLSNSVSGDLAPVVNDIKINSRSALKSEAINDLPVQDEMEVPVSDGSSSVEESNLSNNESSEIDGMNSIGNEENNGSELQEMPTVGFELPPVLDEKVDNEEKKPSLERLDTPFEETPAPDFENISDVSPLSEQVQQTVIQETPSTPAAIGAQFVNDEGGVANSDSMPNISNDLHSEENVGSIAAPTSDLEGVPTLNSISNENLESSSEMLGKDYGALMDEALNSNEQQLQQLQQIQDSQQSRHEFVGANPALMAAPGVADAPEENNVPGIDFSDPVGMMDDEKPAGAAQNDIGVLGRDYPTDVQPLAPSQVANNAPHLAPLPHSDSVSFVSEQNNSVQGAMTVPTQMMTPEPKPVGMPLPGEEILPPPPTPPVDFGAVQTTQLGNEPVLPPVDNNIFNNSVVVQPDSLANQQPQIQAQPIVQPQPVVQPQPMPPVNNDPSAFRIPGM